MVEAVVAIPFFILIFASILYVGNLYGTKQKTLRLAKQQAWTHALANCDSNVASTESTGDPMADLGNTSEYDPSSGAMNNPGGGDVGEYSGASGGGEVTRSMGTASATVTDTVVADPVIGGFSNELSTTTVMQCNEKTHDGNILGVLRMAWQAARFW